MLEIINTSTLVAVTVANIPGTINKRVSVFSNGEAMHKITNTKTANLAIKIFMANGFVYTNGYWLNRYRNSKNDTFIGWSEVRRMKSFRRIVRLNNYYQQTDNSYYLDKRLEELGRLRAYLNPNMP